MRLFVTDSDVEATLDQVVMTIDEFCDVCNHPYISTSNFDVIVIDLEDKIPTNLFKACIGKSIVVPRLTHEITVNTVRLLSELYREKGAMLRAAWLKERANIDKIVGDIAEEFNWTKYY